MKFKINDIVKLKDGGKTAYVIISTKETESIGIGFDYVVKKKITKNGNVYQRYVFEENVYSSDSLT